MLTVLAISVGLNARKFFEFRLDDEGQFYETTSLMEYPPYIVFSNTWQELFVTGVLPFLGLLYCNIRIYGKIRESTRHESHRSVLGWVTADLIQFFMHVIYISQVCGKVYE